MKRKRASCDYEHCSPEQYVYAATKLAQFQNVFDVARYRQTTWNYLTHRPRSVSSAKSGKLCRIARGSEWEWAMTSGKVEIDEICTLVHELNSVMTLFS